MGKQRRRRDRQDTTAGSPQHSGAAAAAGVSSAPAAAPDDPRAGPGAGWQTWLQRRWFAPALFACVALVYFWQFPLSDKIIFGQDVGTDFHKGEAPVIEKLKDVVPSAWDPRMGGYPISEEIRHKFFPTYLIELFTTHQRAIGWRYLLAVFGAGWGMFLYLRRVGAGPPAALWGGLAYLSAPVFLSFPYAGQYAKMTVIALFPFMCLCLERGMDDGRKALGWWVTLAVLITLGVFSPHLQMLQYALLGLGLYFLYKVVALYLDGMPRSQLAQRVGLFALAAALGLGLGAEGVFPPYLHVKTQSKRAAIGGGSAGDEAQQLEHARSWSLHPEEIASLLVPEFVGFDDPTDPQHRYWGRNGMKLNSEYFGILVVLLGIVAVPMARGRPLIWFLGGLFVLVTSFTLGGHTPVHWLAYHLLPGGKVLRTIGMAAFLFAFPAVVLAVLALQRVLAAATPEARDRLGRRILIVGGVLAGLAALTALAPRAVLEGWARVFWSDIPGRNRQVMLGGTAWLARGALIVAFVSAAGTALLVLRLRGRVTVLAVVLGLSALTLVDTWRIDRRFLRYEDPARWTDFRKANPRTVEFLNSQPGKFRVYPLPDYRFLSDARFHLEGADVVSAFNNYTLRRYDRLLKELNGVEQVYSAKWYSRQQVPYTDEQLLGAIHPLLNLVNARYIVVPRAPGFELSAPGFPEVFDAEGVRLYENPQALPWFELVPAARVLTDEDQILETLRAGKVDLRTTAVLEAPSPVALPGPEAGLAGDAVTMEAYDYHDGIVRVRTRAHGPRLLVVSDNYHPNWHATVDGEPVDILCADYVWKAVPVPAGAHTVELTYHSRPVAISRAVSAGCALVVVGWIGFALWRRPGEGDGADGVMG